MASLAHLQSYLPQHPGLLPPFLVFVGVVSFANSIQAYLTLQFTQQVYLGAPSSTNNPALTSPATPLSSRTFGTWTTLAGLVRIYAAYNIDNAAFYQLGFATYLLAAFHFYSEWLVFGTARWGRGLAGPAFAAAGGLLWMWLQWGYYVK
ncbi:Erg28-like protein [Trichodelitschia bisporula]|uniref:Erg28-like protein n=1 Tax=Trichodelitschia bisporula TaxID=703511 RepID=A0A6G1I5E0_9PEZI|nr:Erg28-like protein [Trichodelitschia bisporula]